MTTAAVNTPVPLPGALIFWRNGVKASLVHATWHIRPGKELCLGKSSFVQCCDLPGCGYVEGDTGKNLTGNTIARKDELLLVIQDHIKCSPPWMRLCFKSYLSPPHWSKQVILSLNTVVKRLHLVHGGCCDLDEGMRTVSAFLRAVTFSPSSSPWEPGTCLHWSPSPHKPQSLAELLTQQGRIDFARWKPAFLILSLCTVFLFLGNCSLLAVCFFSSLLAYICWSASLYPFSRGFVQKLQSIKHYIPSQPQPRSDDSSGEHLGL